jgi:glutamate racemase
MRPIGVFDSGVGGLSVLQALQVELPQEQFVYVADNGHAPYGERDDEHVLKRSHAIADYLIAEHDIKALVVACNTATAAAIHTIRAAYPQIPIVGIEPALKPAAALSKTARVGVMATRSTLNSEKFHKLLESLLGAATFVLQPCDGLAIAIERSDTERVEALCKEYTAAMGTFGANPGDIDTLVLGCTHFTFAAETLACLIGPHVTLMEGGAPVARQTKRLLEKTPPYSGFANAPAEESVKSVPRTTGVFYSTGDTGLLDAAVRRWLNGDSQTQALSVG